MGGSEEGPEWVNTDLEEICGVCVMPPGDDTKHVLYIPFGDVVGRGSAALCGSGGGGRPM